MSGGYAVTVVSTRAHPRPCPSPGTQAKVVAYSDKSYESYEYHCAATGGRSNTKEAACFALLAGTHHQGLHSVAALLSRAVKLWRCQ